MSEGAGMSRNSSSIVNGASKSAMISAAAEDKRSLSLADAPASNIARNRMRAPSNSTEAARSELGTLPQSARCPLNRSPMSRLVAMQWWAGLFPFIETQCYAEVIRYGEVDSHFFKRKE